ncbi:hypothetical protein F7U75_22560, partial [Vibrio vulnificus]|nr:hypothetical protein [Vibrio vulnificus]
MEPNDKINLISFSETRGGAAKATRSLYNALLNHGVNAHLIVAEAKSEGSIAVSPGKLQSFMHFLLRLIAFALGKALRYKGASKLSFNFFSSSFVVKKIFERNYIHINWVNNETVSLDDLAKICECKKVIIT